MNFKSHQMPSVVVNESTGKACLTFIRKDKKDAGPLYKQEKVM
jgi:hypothetical protein